MLVLSEYKVDVQKMSANKRSFKQHAFRNQHLVHKSAFFICKLPAKHKDFSNSHDLHARREKQRERGGGGKMQ
jgi:hypothetical protein